MLVKSEYTQGNFTTSSIRKEESFFLVGDLTSPSTQPTTTVSQAAILAEFSYCYFPVLILINMASS